MPDPTTYSYTTAAVPEWAEAATGDARDAEIERLRKTLAAERAISNGLSTACCRLKVELVDVKAECCRLVCRNGDLEAENKRLMVAGGEVSAMRYLASHSLDTAIYKLELAMAGTPSVCPPSVPTAARKPVSHEHAKEQS